MGVPWRVAFALQDAGWYLRCDIVWSKPNPMPESVTDRPTRAHEYIFLLSKQPKYFYDAEAIREAVAESQVGRVRDDVIGGTSHAERGQHSKGGRYKTPAGWDQSEGAHGTIHQEGRSNRDNFRREDSKRLLVHPNQTVGTHRPDRKDNTYDLTSRNKRSVWNIATRPYAEAHFATFPDEIPKLCILAGTSARGCCDVCGAPWKRKVAKEFVPQTDVSLYAGVRGLGEQKPMDESNGWQGVPRGTTKRETKGWEKGCKCLSGERPALVLDPFNGAGTTGLVASKLQRSYLGIEMNPEYVAMSKKRFDDKLGTLLPL